MVGIAKKCPCLRPKIDDEVRVLDYRHSNLHDVPGEVFNKERTLEELCVDSNQIRDLPRELFFCHGLRKLSISDNELTIIPPAISSLANLEELDFSKNGIIDVPDSIRSCKYLRSIDASVNPLGKLPEGFTCLPNLTHLYLNDTFLDYLPGSCGRMVKLKILELRENHIKTLPRSFSRLVDLERLDIGNNEFTELTDVLDGLSSLLELWCDNNQITTITRRIGRLKHLMFLDASNNQLQELPKEIDGCVSLADLHITSNKLMELPDTIGNLGNLITLKIDDNQLVYLPRTLGGLSSLSELNVSSNDLEDLPAGIGLLRNLRTFYADDNLLSFIPAEIGSCSGITVLSLRCNKLTYIPDELGRIPRLRVLNLSDNLLRYLPFSIIKLKELQALWLTENQTRPLIPLQSEYEAGTGRKILTCYLLPQCELTRNDAKEYTEDGDSFHSSMWDEERLSRQQIHFAFVDGSDEEGTLVRCPTPHPKEMKQRQKHANSLTMKPVINAGNRSRACEGVLDEADTADHGTRKTVYTDETNHQGIGYFKLPGQSDVRARDNQATKPPSPKLQESHRLYRHDKEMLMKDKARLQHRLSVPDFDTGLNGVLKNVLNTSKKVKLGEARLSGRSGSVPNLTSGDNKETTPAANAPRIFTSPASSAQEDLYYKQIVHRHKGRRSRRIREYDSDTDYRSDYELIRFKDVVRDNSSQGINLEILSVQSQPLPHHYYHHDQIKGGWKEPTRCASDLKGYSSGGSFPTANAAAAAFQRKYHQQNQFQGQSPLYSAVPSRTGTPVMSQNFRPNCPLQLEFDPRSGSDIKPKCSRIKDYKENTRSRSDYSLNSTKTGNHNIPGDINNTVPDDEFYEHASSSEYYPSFQVETNFVTTTNNHYSSNQKSSVLAHTNTSETSFKPHLTSGPTLQISTEPESLMQNQIAPPQNGVNLDHSFMLADKLNLNNLSSSMLSLQRSSRSSTPSLPVYEKDSFVDQSAPLLGQAPLSLAESTTSLNFSAVSDRKGSKLCTVLEERSNPQINLYSGHSASPRQSPTVPPPYNSASLYRKPLESKGSGSRANRLSSDSSSLRGNSPQSSISIHETTVEASPLVSSSVIQNLIVNRSDSSSCGFHGSSPYQDLPVATREKISFTNYADSDRRRQNKKYDNLSYKGYRDNQASRSSSSCSQIGSASQIRPEYDLGVDAREGHDQSDSSDSQSDMHNISSGHEFSPSDRAYESSHPYSGEDRPHDSHSHSFENGNYDELFMIPNQEQSSQVSSSTDSGYSHGHHVYELIGDHLITKCEKYSRHGGQVSEEPKVTSVGSSQRSIPLKGSGKTSSRDGATPASTSQELKNQFRVTIKKNPGLGFSIAGGIGSHGNPFREKDIGIFVTKVIQEGPASKSLRPGDKILEVNKVDFKVIEHNQAVAVLKKNNIVTLLIERVQRVNVV